MLCRALLLSGVCVLAVYPAHAQDSVADQTPATAESANPTQDGDDIIVTGTRVLDSPLLEEEGAATSLKEDVFRFAGSSRRADVLRSVPGLVVFDLGNRTNIVIRGMSTAPDGDPNGSSVQSYFGGVPLSGLGGSRENADLSNYDIERIDVLRGVQGFSFGAGSLGGIVRTVPNPADTSGFSAKLAATVKAIDQGANYGWETDGFINVPLIDDVLAVRATGYVTREESPYSSAIDFRQSSPDRLRGGRLSLRYQPTSAITVDLRYIYDDHDLPGLSRSVGNQGDYVTTEYPKTEGSTTHLVMAEASWNLGLATLSYVGSYGEVDTDSAYFSSFYVTPDFDQVLGRDAIATDWVTQELRLSNADDVGLDWTIGGYFEDRSRNNSGTYYILGTDTQTVITNFTGGPDILSQFRGDEQRQIAGFGELAYWITPELKLAGGVRYRWYEQTNLYTETYSDGSVDDYDGAQDNIPPEGKWWWKGEVTWKPTSGQLYYLQVAQASRPGGLNYGSIDASCPPEYAARLEQFYRGDTIRTYEAGAKLINLGGIATINAAAYYSRWKDASTYTAVPCGGFDTTYLDNVQLLELYGAEFEATVRIARPLSATVAVSWAESRIAEIEPNFVGGEVGERTPGQPTWKLSGSLDYAAPISPDINFFAGARVDYIGEYKNALSVDWSYFVPITGYPGIEDVYPIGTFPSGLTRYNDPGAGGYALVNARIGVESDAWTGNLFIDNVLDSHARTIINMLDYTPTYDATLTRVTPRTIGVRVERRF